ncbi:MAG: DUF349 domain-containing protein, partial [Algoriphagus sp.]
MTDKSNELSGQDKVTQTSKPEEEKGIDKKTDSATNENLSSEQVSGNVSEDQTKAEQGSDEVTELPKAEEASPKTEKAESTEPTVVFSEVKDNSNAEAISPMSDVRETSEKEPVSEESSVETTSDEEESEEEEDLHEEDLDISSLSKIELVALLKSKVKQDNIYRIDKLVHEIKVAFDEFTHKEKEEALDKFKAEGGAEDDFDFRPSDEEKEFNTYYFEYRHQLGALRKEAEKQKEN